MRIESPMLSLQHAAVIFGIAMLASCTFEPAKTTPAEGWGLDTGQNADPGNDTSGQTEPDVGPVDATVRPEDSGAPVPDVSAGDATPPDDVAEPTPDEGMEPTLGPGDACDRNNECIDDLVCCPSRTGPSCTDDCWGGGVCEDETDCGPDEGCCEFGGGTRFCSDRCAENNGNNMNSCMTNSSCQDSEVCCISFGGSSECRQGDNCDGWYGGVCEDNADCRGGQECCRTNWGNGCGDECP
jgi:hypothetical protein